MRYINLCVCTVYVCLLINFRGDQIFVDFVGFLIHDDL